MFTYMEEKLTEKLIQTLTYLILYQKRMTSINKTDNAMRRDSKHIPRYKPLAYHWDSTQCE